MSTFLKILTVATVAVFGGFWLGTQYVGTQIVIRPSLTVEHHVASIAATITSSDDLIDEVTSDLAAEGLLQEFSPTEIRPHVERVARLDAAGRKAFAKELEARRQKLEIPEVPGQFDNLTVRNLSSWSFEISKTEELLTGLARQDAEKAMVKKIVALGKLQDYPATVRERVKRFSALDESERELAAQDLTTALRSEEVVRAVTTDVVDLVLAQFELDRKLKRLPPPSGPPPDGLPAKPLLGPSGGPLQ
jgi:hypothetical protein